MYVFVNVRAEIEDALAVDLFYGSPEDRTFYRLNTIVTRHGQSTVYRRTLRDR